MDTATILKEVPLANGAGTRVVAHETESDTYHVVTRRAGEADVTADHSFDLWEAKALAEMVLASDPGIAAIFRANLRILAAAVIAIDRQNGDFAVEIIALREARADERVEARRVSDGEPG